MLALALGAFDRGLAGRHGAALGLAVAAAFVRPESWLFVGVYGMWLWRRAPPLRWALIAAAVAIPLLWFGPELLGSGDALRSGARARIPNPGQPALAAVPAWASLREAAALPPLPAWAGVAVLAASAVRSRGVRRRRARALAPAAAGGAWLALVAAMAQAGFSGEPRYALPGAALISISGGVGLARVAAPASRRLKAAAGLGLLVALALTASTSELTRIPAGQAHQAALASDLRDAIGRAGGRDAILACGTPYTGPYRGTLTAYQLDVAKRAVVPDRPPRAPGVVLASRPKPGSRVWPVPPAGFETVTVNRSWQVAADCGGRAAPY